MLYVARRGGGGAALATRAAPRAVGGRHGLPGRGPHCAGAAAGAVPWDAAAAPEPSLAAGQEGSRRLPAAAEHVQVSGSHSAGLTRSKAASPPTTHINIIYYINIKLVYIILM